MTFTFQQGKSFIRDKARYPHDAFGAITGGRTIPHSGADQTPIPRGSTAGDVQAFVGGIVVAEGFDKEAGWYVIIEGDDGRWWGYGHSSWNYVKVGWPVKATQGIARFGATGGVTGVHSHIWVAVDLASALRIVFGYVAYRKGNLASLAAWSKFMGLVDPEPLIMKAAKKAEAEATKPVPAPTPEPITEEILMSKTLLYRNTGNGATIVANLGGGLGWHIPNTGMVPYARSFADSPDIIECTPDVFRTLLQMLDEGHDAEKIKQMREQLTR